MNDTDFSMSLASLLIFQVREWREQDKEFFNPVEYEKYIQSPEWKIRSDAAKDRAGHQCAICASPENLNTHHRTYIRLGHELPEDLIVLCKTCHGKFHDRIRPLKLEVAF